MRNRKSILYPFLPVIITFCLYLVFYSEIEISPARAGFWLVLAMGMSVGVVLCRLIQWPKDKK
ncbi:MAG: hypothetical protein IMY71_02280 [Bacteroidetes bacterium]|nr:hypothetical protein [Bacteroidota bacterium]